MVVGDGLTTDAYCHVVARMIWLHIVECWRQGVLGHAVRVLRRDDFAVVECLEYVIGMLVGLGEECLDA